MGANDCCCGRHNAAEGSKMIGIASTVISILSVIGFIWRYIKLEEAKNTLQVLLNQAQYEARFSETVHNQTIAIGTMIGISLVCILVAIALIFAAKNKNPTLCLPFMIWTIICQIGAGIVACCLIFFLAVGIPSARNDEDLSNIIEVFLVPLIFVIAMFVLNTWWLIVVFNFHRLLKNGHAFDSIPMQTA